VSAKKRGVQSKERGKGEAWRYWSVRGAGGKSREIDWGVFTKTKLTPVNVRLGAGFGCQKDRKEVFLLENANDCEGFLKGDRSSKGRARLGGFHLQKRRWGGGREFASRGQSANGT